MNAAVYCGSMGDWPLLTDDQRQTGVTALVEAGVPATVGTAAATPRTAVAPAAHARAARAPPMPGAEPALPRSSRLACRLL